MQLEMFGGSPLAVRAAPGAEEPLLWVRRLVIWSEPGVILRDVPLRRGLNVVWSPDPADVEGAERVTEGGFGHGAGKSLFCRLIRYCLGETSFGTDTQREKIFRAYRDGRVGAEIVLRGTTWSIERALGIFAGDRVVRGVGLDGLDAVGAVVLGMDVFADALRDELLGAQASALVARPAGEAWLTALACLTRDQEARLAGATAWRVASAGSASPVADLPAREASRRFRVLVRASEEIERRLKAREQRLVSKRKIAVQSRQQEAWAFRRRVILWAERLGLRAVDVPDGKLAIEALRQAAAGAKSLPARSVPPAETASELEHAYEVRLRAYHAVDTELAKCGFELTSTGAAIALRESELSPLFRAVQNAESPHCPLCEVPVDRVLLG